MSSGYDGRALNSAWLDAPLASSVPVGPARYSDFAPLGMGGKAEVFRCLDLTLGRQVAYKVLRQDLMGCADEQVRLVREARLMARMSHCSIPEVYELGRDLHQRPYFTMRAASGVTLQRLLDRMRSGDGVAERGFFMERRIRVLEQAAHALGYAHACGVVHNDLKPDNLLVDVCEATTLIDWGLAELVDGATCREAHRPRHGTPLHMPPEQILAKGLSGDPRSDVYQLGTVLYECLALRPIASGANVQEVLRNIVDSPVVAPREVNGDHAITPELEHVCLRSVSKDPGDRYADGAEFADALRDCLLDLLIRFDRDPDLPCDSLLSSNRGEREKGSSAESAVDPTIPSAQELDAWWALRTTDKF